MKIEMECVVCKEKIVLDDLPELEIDEDRDIESLTFYCPECGKTYYLGG